MCQLTWQCGHSPSWLCHHSGSPGSRHPTQHKRPSPALAGLGQASTAALRPPGALLKAHRARPGPGWQKPTSTGVSPPLPLLLVTSQRLHFSYTRATPTCVWSSCMAHQASNVFHYYIKLRIFLLDKSPLVMSWSHKNPKIRSYVSFLYSLWRTKQ